LKVFDSVRIEPHAHTLENDKHSSLFPPIRIYK
jgi:hypothetical protein